MADLTADPTAGLAETAPPEVEEIRRQVFEATGHSLTNLQLLGVTRALAAGARFDAFLALMAEGFGDPARVEETVQALDAFAQLPPEPVS